MFDVVRHVHKHRVLCCNFTRVGDGLVDGEMGWVGTKSQHVEHESFEVAKRRVGLGRDPRDVGAICHRKESPAIAAIDRVDAPSHNWKPTMQEPHRCHAKSVALD